MNTKKTLATSILAGGMLFSGGADAANVLLDSSFEHPANVNVDTDWGRFKPYAQTYGGVLGPDLNLVTTVDYGYNDNITMGSGSTFMGVEKAPNNTHILTQTASLVNADLTLAQIQAGEGKFALSAWMQTCCNDAHAITLTFDDAASTTYMFDLTTTQYRITTADKEVNPGGSNNGTSETNLKYWKFYEVKADIPTDAENATVEITIAPGGTVHSGGDFGTDLLILDAVAVPVPEPSSTALLGLGGLALILRRRK